MKTFFLAFISMIFVKACGQPSTDQHQDTTVIYQTITRGSSNTYTLSKERLEIQSKGVNSKEQSVEVSASQWQEIENIMQQLDLQKISEYSASTEDSARDVALQATLTVETTADSYQSQSFDHGNPPAELAPLVKAILTLAESVE
jgi:hypothetical protein